MKISKQKRTLLGIIANRSSVTSNEFYATVFIGRFPNRLNEMRKDWGVNYIYKDKTYFFTKEGQEKARKILDENFDGLDVNLDEKRDYAKESGLFPEYNLDFLRCR